MLNTQRRTRTTLLTSCFPFPKFRRGEV
uniref:Uncharacterized protein n=1 Tax=Anguilla anguilla TaxID=7936 RepID=A0A0E9RSN6_ANGAN